MHTAVQLTHWRLKPCTGQLKHQWSSTGLAGNSGEKAKAKQSKERHCTSSHPCPTHSPERGVAWDEVVKVRTIKEMNRPHFMFVCFSENRGGGMGHTEFWQTFGRGAAPFPRPPTRPAAVSAPTSALMRPNVAFMPATQAHLLLCGHNVSNEFSQAHAGR